mgnify:CR=1 FL=1
MNLAVPAVPAVKATANRLPGTAFVIIRRVVACAAWNAATANGYRKAIATAGDAVGLAKVADSLFSGGIAPNGKHHNGAGVRSLASASALLSVFQVK